MSVHTTELYRSSLSQREQLVRLARSKGLKSRNALPPIISTERIGVIPLSFAQQRLWFLSRFEEASTAYHIAAGLRLIGRLEREALVRALDRIVARHEALRTVFVQGDDGVPVQQDAAAEAGFALSAHDL